MMIFLLAVLGAALVVLLWAALAYNGLVGLRNMTKNAWAQIDVQLKRRHDLIPNLVETAKGYMAHEKSTLENVIRARNAAVAAQGVADQARAETLLTGALRGLLAVAENYPNLKANETMLELQEELTATENKIAFARQYYNDSVYRYNTKRETVPSNIIANLFGFSAAELFETEDAEERRAVKVSFS